MVIVISLYVWQIRFDVFLTALSKGTTTAFDIFLIIFGAIFFLLILQKTRILTSVEFYLERLSGDYRVQVIILAWFLENFIEGTAGFGTPAVVVAPLLISLGLAPLQAVVISLLGNSSSVVFGAAGTPIRTGFAGLDVAGVPLYAALFNLVGVLVPVFMLWILTSNKEDSKKQFLEVLPFAIFSGAIFVLLSLATVFLGQEFPSILGSVFGVMIVFLTTKIGVFVPKNIRRLKEERLVENKLPLFKTVSPYVLLIGLLVLGKYLLGPINLFNPGWAFFISGLTAAILWYRKNIYSEILEAIKRTLEPFLVVLFMAIFTQIMIFSGNNATGYSSILSILAKNFENNYLPFFAPFIGAFGSFITGSATVSNLMFGGFLLVAAGAVKISTGVVLALQLVGAAAGNMFALADMLAAQAVVGLKNSERAVLKGVIGPCLIYIFLVGIIGMIFVAWTR